MIKGYKYHARKNTKQIKMLNEKSRALLDDGILVKYKLPDWLKEEFPG